MKKIVLAIVCVLLAIVLLQACGADNNAEPIQWSTLELGAYLPEPENTNGKISVDLASALSVTLQDVTKEQFKAYIDDCVGVGYTIESEETGTTYVAFNSEGYEVRLVHSSEELYIHLDAPEKMEEFEWPVNGLGAMLPVTKSTLGDISWDNSETFIVHVGNTTIDDYKDYVKECEDLGFTVDYSRDDEYYSAKNIDGYKLTLRYLGFNKIEVSLKAPEGETSNEDASNNETDPSEENKPTEGSSSDGDMIDGMSIEFKEAMDSYESFMDEYVAFMKKYSANPADLSLLTDYADYMSKYADFIKDFEKWEDEEMNAAEMAYYIDVQARVSKKLLEIA